jgi:hypothetical protein
VSDPVIVDIPHKLGRDAAKVRLESGLEKLTSFIPGSTVANHRWDGNSLFFTVKAFGQTAGAKLDVFEDRVRAELSLPAVLASLAGKAKEFLAQNGQKLLR